MLFTESKTARTDRTKESLMPQAAENDYNYMWGFFPVYQDLLISFLHLFLFLTQRISKYFAIPS